MSNPPMRNPFPKGKLSVDVSAFLILTAVTLACLCPFLGKAFYIDDPLFIWSARHILSEPWNFYNFTVNWNGFEQPMAAVTQNPPLDSYYLALVGWLFGWSEIALHAGFLLPALALVLGTYRLARSFCAHPLAAALITATAPAFLLSGTSVMCDTMMLAYWVWSLAFWMEGLAENRPVKLCLSAFLIASCALTKYFGIALVPMVLAYSLMERRKIGPWLACLLIPVIILACYEWWTHQLYGRGSVLDALAYVRRQQAAGGDPMRILSALAFSGGLIIILLPLAPLLWGKRALAAGTAALVLFGLFVVALKKVGKVPTLEGGRANWLFVAQFSLFVAAGAGLILLAAAELFRRKTAAAALLFFWVAGTLGYAVDACWTVSGRYLLPMLPAVSILLVRRLELRQVLHERNRLGPLLGPLAVSLAVALMVAWADFEQAGSARAAASHLQQQVRGVSSTIWFEGHWGFQYYMEQLDARPINGKDIHFSPNDAIIVPKGNTYLVGLPRTGLAPWFEYDAVASTWLTTMNGASGAGFYSDAWGPLPFVFCKVPAEHYVVLRAE